MLTESAILTATFTTVGRSAWETLLEVDRQARKDAAKVERFLKSEEVREALQWGAAIALALGAVAFILGQEFRSLVDGFVEASLEQEEATEEAAIALLPDAQPLTVMEVVCWQRPTVTAPVEVVAPAPVARPRTARRARIEALFAQAEELHQRTMVSDAALLAVAQVAVNALDEGEGAIAARWA